jgi:nucleotide-binding universal stress UspA family protein
MSFKHIVVAINFSPSWPRLRRRLERLREWGAERATLVYVLESRYPAAPEIGHRGHYEDKLAAEARSLAELGYSVDWEIRTGEAGAELALAARKHNADLLLLGHGGHGWLRELFMGDTALDAARLTRTPLWLEPTAGDQPAEAGDWLLLATDGSEAARHAEECFRALAPHLRRAIAVTATGRVQTDDQEKADARAHLAEVIADLPGAESRVLDGDPRDVTVAMARELPAELVIVGKRGRNPLIDLLLGSTAETVCNRTRRPVLLVPARNRR